MKFLSGFFIITIAACVLSGCAPPIGYVGGSGSGKGTDLDALWVIPNRLFYEKGDFFNPVDDLQILSSDKGLTRQVSPSETGLTITISESTSFGVPKNPAVVGPNPYIFPLPGIYFVEVSYNSKKARYTVEVRGYYVEPGDGSDFVEIIWL